MRRNLKYFFFLNVIYLYNSLNSRYLLENCGIIFSATNGVKNMPISSDVKLGTGVQIFHPEMVNLYGCEIGDNTKIGTFVEIQKNAFIGAQCKISSHTFICEGVTIEDQVFIGHGVMFTNDMYPRAAGAEGMLTEEDWEMIPTRVCTGASIGSGAVIRCGITIGPNAMIGAGAVVLHDVPAGTVVAGVPERIIGNVKDK